MSPFWFWGRKLNITISNLTTFFQKHVTTNLGRMLDDVLVQYTVSLFYYALPPPFKV